MGKCIAGRNLICEKSHQLSVTFYDGWKFVRGIWWVWRRNKDTSKCSSLSPPLAKASADCESIQRRHFLTTLCLGWRWSLLFLYRNRIGNDWQNDKKGAAFPYCWFHPDSSLMIFHDVFDNGKPKPGTFHIRIDVRASIEFIEDMWLVWSRNSRALIGYS